MPAYQALCSVNVPITDNLFGDDIDSKVKELDTAKKLGNKVGKIKNTSITAGHSGKPYEHHIPTFTLPTLPSPRQFGMNPRFVQKLPLQFRQYRQVPFLGNRPPLRLRGGPPRKDKYVTELHVSTCKYKLKLINTKENFCGWKISSIFDKWTKLTSDKFVLDIVTVVKELRSKMLGQHPGYFKVVFLKKTQIIIVSIYEYTVYIMF